MLIFLKANDRVPPKVSDSFDGGGSIPPDAVRFPHGTWSAALKHPDTEECPTNISAVCGRATT